MSRAHNVIPRTTLLDTLMAEHGALDATTASVALQLQGLSLKERAEIYHQRYREMKTRQSLKIVEQALANPQSHGSGSST